MQVFTDLSDLPDDFGPSVVTIGKFDGLHLGHRAILGRLLDAAAANDLTSVVVTFDRNPLATLRPDARPVSLLGPSVKAERLAEIGVDACLMLHFDAAFAALPPEDFVERFLVAGMRARVVFVGSDFRYGHDGAGDVALLRRMGAERGFEVVEIDDVLPDGDRRVSSSWIRELLSVGDVRAATALLTRPPMVRGEVVHGLKRGRELGYPTANLTPDLEGFIPADGVYAGVLIVDGARMPAAISVGDNPTFDGVAKKQVEAYVLDRTDLDLYGQVVDLEFVERLRGMVAFEGIEKLIAQMDDDVVRTRVVLGHPGGA